MLLSNVNQPVRIRAGKREQLRAPKELQDLLTRRGGRNRFGGPNFRLVWGWEPSEFIFDKKVDSYQVRPRYPNRSRWYIERWNAPESYGTPETWRKQFTENINGKEVDLLGPFPTFGCYEFFLKVERPHVEWCKEEGVDICACGGGYVALNESVIEDMFTRFARSLEIRASQRKSDVLTRVEAEWEKHDPEIDAIIDDVMPAFKSATHVALGNKNALPTRGVLSK